MSELNMNELLSFDGMPGLEEEQLERVHPPLVLREVASNPENRSVDIQNDYSAVRKNMHFQSQMIMDMAMIALENAKNAESPRHVEVFATLMGQMTHANKELLRIHKDMKDITDESMVVNQPTEAGEGQVWYGSPEDLIEMSQTQ